MPRGKPTNLDKVIGYLSPQWGVKRLAWRDIQASYQGGINTRLDQGWERSTSFALGTQQDRRQLASARDRARAADRNNPVANGLLNREVDNVVSEGFTLQPRTEIPDFNKEAKEEFGEWFDTADIHGREDAGGFQRLAYRTARRDGDAAIVLVDEGGKSKLQLVPGDLIRTPDMMVNTPTLADGVQTNLTGRAISYWIADFDEWGKRKFTSIDANQVVFLSHTSEPLQVRGETCFLRNFDYLNYLDRYVDGVALAAWMATVFGLVIKEQNGAKALGGAPLILNSQGNQQRAITLENGAIKFAGVGDEMLQIDAKQPMQQTPDFIRMLLRLIGLPFDMPLELALLDVSQANLSSLRGGMQQYYRACKNRQQKFSGKLSMIYRWWVSRQVKADKFVSKVPDKYWPHTFRPRGWGFTDPVKELQAALMEMDAGLNSEQNIDAALGRDWDHIQEQRAEAAAKRQKLGLPEIRSIMTRDPLTPAPLVTPLNPNGDEPDDDLNPD
jgi:lambda family phage portal protein